LVARAAPKLKAVFDTNIVVSALVFGRRLAWLRGAWANGTITPLLCRETAFELLDVLAYPKFKLAKERRDDLLRDYIPFCEVRSLPAPLPALTFACRDRDDELFLHLAISAGADVLITGDGDLLAVRASAPIRIITLSELRHLIG